jgi:hypothetical protein
MPLLKKACSQAVRADARCIGDDEVLPCARAGAGGVSHTIFFQGYRGRSPAAMSGYSLG